MGHGSSTTHKDVCDIELVGLCIQGCGTLTTCSEVWNFGGWHFSYIIFFQFVSKAVATTIAKLKCSTTIIMATKISNVMPKIQTTKFYVFIPITPSLKNVTLSSSNEKEE